MKKNCLIVPLLICFLFSFVFLGLDASQGRTNEVSFYTFAGDFQRTACSSLKHFPKNIGEKWKKELPIHIDDLECLSSFQWLVQSEDALFFHTDTQIIRIDKKTGGLLAIPETVSEEAQKNRRWYDAITYSRSLDVIICGFYQENLWSIAILNSSTLEEIQVVEGFGFSYHSTPIGVVVENDRIYYLQKIENQYHLTSLEVGQKPSIVYVFPDQQQPCTCSVLNELLYFITEVHNEEEYAVMLQCLNPLTGNILWDYTFPDETYAITNFYSYPLCTDKGIVVFHQNQGEGILYSIDPMKGSVLWNQTIPYSIVLKTNMNMEMTANQKTVCLLTKGYVPWQNSKLTRVLVFSTEDGQILRNYTLMNTVQSMYQAGSELIFSFGNSQWIGTMDIDTGLILESLFIAPDQILFNTIWDDTNVWFLAAGPDGQLSLTKLQNETYLLSGH